MSIYEKPTRLLMKDMVKDIGLQSGQPLERKQVLSWFKTHYPKIKEGTVSAHLIKMSTNAPSRIHYKADLSGEDDLLYQIDSKHFRLYTPGQDPLPIYEKIQEDDQESERDDEQEPKGRSTEFAYEQDLKNFLVKNLSLIEPGLTLYEDEGITGVEFPVGGRFVDILALDKKQNFVVIELKVSRGYDRVIGQLLRYIAWIEQHQAEPHQQVRGVIIAKEISADLMLAVSKVADVKLFEYELSVSLTKVSQEANQPQ